MGQMACMMRERKANKHKSGWRQIQDRKLAHSERGDGSQAGYLNVPRKSKNEGTDKQEGETQRQQGRCGEIIVDQGQQAVKSGTRTKKPSGEGETRYWRSGVKRQT